MPWWQVPTCQGRYLSACQNFLWQSWNRYSFVKAMPTAVEMYSILSSSSSLVTGKMRAAFYFFIVCGVWRVLWSTRVSCAGRNDSCTKLVMRALFNVPFFYRFKCPCLCTVWMSFFFCANSHSCFHWSLCERCKSAPETYNAFRTVTILYCYTSNCRYILSNTTCSIIWLIVSA
jgi:hypothetical protein